MFKSQLWREFISNHYFIAILFSNKKTRSLVFHTLYNSSLYLTLLFLLSFISPKLDSDNLTDFRVLIIGCLLLLCLLLLLIFSFHATERDSFASNLQTENTSVGADPADEKSLVLISQVQKGSSQDIGNKGLCLFGLASGISLFSRIPKLEESSIELLLFSFLIIVVLDVLILRNVMIILVTGGLTWVSKRKVLHQQANVDNKIAITHISKYLFFFS